MKLTQGRKDFWIHLNPEGSENFMIHGRTYSEPRFDKKLGHYVVSEEGRLCNDRLSCVNVIAKNFLPEALWDSIKPGMRAHVYNYTFWELKDQNDNVLPTIAQKTDYQPETYFQMQQFTDHLIFGLRGKAELHERYSTFNTRQDDPENPLKVQYVNKYGQVITHGCSNVADSYIMIGCAGEITSPYNVAKLWGSDLQTRRLLDTMLIEAYLMGIRYKVPPKESVINMTLKVISDELIRIIPNNDYYGFPDDMIFSTRKDLKSDPYLCTRSIDKCITGVILAYRWFFNKPDLSISLSLVHDTQRENESLWTDMDKYANYMKAVESCDETDLAKRINCNIETKWQKYKGQTFFKPQDFINTDCFNIVTEDME